MSKTLAIFVDFTDDTDFDFYRAKFVGVVEDAVGDAMDEEEGRKADGLIEVSWDMQDES